MDKFTNTVDNVEEEIHEFIDKSRETNQDGANTEKKMGNKDRTANQKMTCGSLQSNLTYIYLRVGKKKAVGERE